MTQMLGARFFNRDACVVARALLGKVIRRRYRGRWLAARIIETEAYYLKEKASHASLGYTEKRRALFMPPGTLYLYYARGGDSLNVSCRGRGNAVLIKAALPYVDERSPERNLRIMQQLNPAGRSGSPRPLKRLLAGQTLLCRSLALKVPEWDARQFDPGEFYIEDTGVRPGAIIQTTRLGIPPGRDGHLPYRFIDAEYAGCCTQNPLTRRGAQAGRDYVLRRVRR